MARVEAVLFLWYESDDVEPTALMKGTFISLCCTVKLAYSDDGPNALRDTTTVRLPAETVLLSTVTVLLSSVPMAWLAMRRSETAPEPSTMIV